MRNVKPVQGRWKMSKGLQPGDQLPKKSCRIRRYPKLSKKQQKLVEEHLWIAGRLAHSAKSLTGGFTGCYSKEDLQSVAYFALCVAATRYNEDLGWKFSTYAWNTCRGWIQHALRDYSRMVRIPRWISGMREDCRELLSSGMSYEEVGEQLDLDVGQVLMCENSWKEIHYSYDHTPDESRPREFVYEIDEIKVVLGTKVFERVGDLSDADINLMLMYVEGQLDNQDDRNKAEALIEQIKASLG